MEKKVKVAIKQNNKTSNTIARIDDYCVITVPSVGDISIIYTNYAIQHNIIKHCHSIILDLDDNKITIMYMTYNSTFNIEPDFDGLYHFTIETIS